MIVNDVAGKKTTDTESGVWLTNVHTESRERMCAFAVFDGTRKLSFWTIQHIVENELGGMDISYKLYEAPYFVDAPARRGYKEIIQALLERFGYYYGTLTESDERMRCKVIMEPKFLIPLEAWENGKG
jgi:hypothetical protein